ncbi:hypothetical protein [Streptomyces luteolus]|uniref:Tyr recombinase domain-containing protein n=1 Tax=Streptomyces luteolus TaxID=3043615 RepID=A0ABT6T4M1_9ACTN|nr:hypothetical protein [Streptomyces sp. B-S-A12]MDI3422805.1 hypothetical protein [Streptomyces sp. B-S-A12]
MIEAELTDERVASLLAHLKQHHPYAHLWALLAAERGPRASEVGQLAVGDDLLTHLGGHAVPPSIELARALDATEEGIVCPHTSAHLHRVFRAQSEHDRQPPVTLHALRTYFLAQLAAGVSTGRCSTTQATEMARLKERPQIRRRPSSLGRESSAMRTDLFGSWTCAGSPRRSPTASI